RKICRIENVSHLSELRVLNLAGNNISRVENLQKLDCLTELNLRHNCISFVVRGLFPEYRQLPHSHTKKNCTVNTLLLLIRQEQCMPKQAPSFVCKSPKPFPAFWGRKYELNPTLCWFRPLPITHPVLCL
uniref:Dynein assembly factor 1, axonemal n=1 Tax=Echeneis naucrates TaxID=173247 RepID=A0A665VQL1_ECHNA